MVRRVEAVDTVSHAGGGFTKTARGEMMKMRQRYAGSQGWFYEIWVLLRLVEFGWCEDRERAQLVAAAV